jgi:Tol biopolymer transport system component
MLIHRLTLAVIVSLVAALALAVQAQGPGAAGVRLEAAIKAEQVDGNLAGAIQQYQSIVEQYRRSDPVVAARALVRLASAYQARGDAQARATWEQVITDFPAQAEAVTEARARLAASATSGAVTPRLGLLCDDCKDLGSVSRDGRLAVETDWAVGDLIVRDLATGRTDRLLLNPVSARLPDAYPEGALFSPDVRQIAYIWEPDGQTNNELRIVENHPGAKPRVLVNDPRVRWPRPVAWSPDGREILAEFQQGGDRTWQLVWISVTDGRVRVVKSLDWRPAGTTRATLSPDGRFIAYDVLVTNPSKAPSGGELGDRHVYIIPADGGVEVDVTRTAGTSSGPLWSPDGRYLLYLSDRSGTRDLWAIPVTSGKPSGAAVIAKRDLGTAVNISLTSAGVYYYARIAFGRQQVKIAEFDTTGRLPANVRIVESFSGAHPSWSPDGSTVVLSRARQADGINILRSMASGDEAAISSAGLRNGPPRWLSDGGSYLQVYRATDNGPVGFVSVDVRQRTTRSVIPPTPGRSGVAALSPDGRTLFQFAKDSSTDDTSVPFSRIIATNLGTAEEREVVRLPGTRGDLPLPSRVTLAISPDGTTLAVVTGKGNTPNNQSTSLSLVGIDGTGFREIHSFLNSGQVNDRLSWTRDGRFLLFAAVENNLWRVMRIPVSGGQPEFTGLETRYLGPFSVSPDGQRMAFTVTDVSGNELWAADLSHLWSGGR